MNPHRQQIRKMSNAALIAVFEASALEVKDSQQIFCGLFGELPKDYLEKGVRDGWLKCSTIEFAGKPCYRFFWQKVAGENLHILMTHLLPGGISDASLWMQAFEQLANDEKCVSITTSTAQKAVVVELTQWGMEPTGIMFKKQLSLKPAMDTKELQTA